MGNLSTTQPAIPLADYEAGRNYGVGESVTDGGIQFFSRQTPNKGNTPLSSLTFWVRVELLEYWNTNETYENAPITSIVRTDDGKIVRSLTDSNQGNDPALTFGTQWEDIVVAVGPQEVRQPTNLLPLDAAVNVTVPTLVSNEYGTLFNVPQASSQFLVSTDVSMSPIVHDSGTIPGTTTHTVPGGVLLDSTEYFWQKRDSDVESNDSLFSSVTSFTTGTLNFIEQPTITFPTSGATDISKQFTATSSAYAVSGPADAQTASIWRIFLDSSRVTKVYDSGEVADLVSHQIPAGVLDGLVEYFIDVIHVGTALPDSAPSALIDFTTTALDVDWANYDGSEDGAELILSANQTNQATFAFVELQDNLIIGLSDNGGTLDNISLRKTGTSLTELTVVVAGAANPTGGFPKNNSTLDNTTLLRVFESNGINNSTVTITAVTLPTSRVHGADAYIQFADDLFYIGNATNILGYSLNEAGDDVEQDVITTSSNTGQKIALSRDKKFIVGMESDAINAYDVAIYNAGGLVSPQVDFITRGGLSKGSGESSGTIDWFDDTFFAAIWPQPSNGDLVCDIYSVDEAGALTQVSTDHVIKATGFVDTFSSSQVPGDQILIATDEGRQVISYDSVLDTVTLEAEVLEAGTNEVALRALNDGDVIRYVDKASDIVQILSARV